MAELVGGAVLQAVFGVILERLTPHNAEFLKFIRGKKLDNNLLHRLKPSLNAARSVLNDAELKHFKDPAVKDWLDDLKDVVYQVEDFMYDISTISATQNQVLHFSFASDLTMHDTDMANKLEAITSKLEFIVAQKDILGLKTNVETNKNLSRLVQSTSRVKLSDVYGREKDKEAIIKLMSDDNNDKLSVIPIVGMGGIGKTTLAQLVYNDEFVKQNFDLKAWVCVSEAFDLLKITQTVIKTISPNHAFDIMDLNLLQLDLEEKLCKRKFFVVLDDVWNDKYIEWDTLMIPFYNGMEGSKIIVTTRSERVASMVKTIPSFYRRDFMSDEDCLSLFARHAFNSRDSSLNSSCLEKIGRDIISKCKGLPLAAKALGGLFRSKPDVQHWTSMLKNDVWNSVEDEVVPALRVSYHYLPPHLKQCIVYCSLFPKAYEFHKKDLILMWMAEGFLQPSNREMMTLEEIGYDYFDDLTSRSFFQPSSKTDGYFVMHDLIHDLTISVAGDFFFRLEKSDGGKKISSKARHLSYVDLSFPSLDDIESFKGAKALRTMIGFDSWCIPGSIGNTLIVLDLKYLRVLSFKSFRASKIVPDSIDEFIHLRYFDLSETSIGSLPNSLCKLHNLQTLKLHHCFNLNMLPNDMQDLVNLRYLGFRGAFLKKMPRGMSKLKNLQFLSKFIVGGEQGTTIQELGELQNLSDILVISKLENIEHSNQAQEAKMMEKKHIKELTFSWSSDDCANDSQAENDIIEKLQPHLDLEGLKMIGYRGTIFPDWLGHGSYHNMTNLSLHDCKNCWKLPPLGQLPALKKLHIFGFDRVVAIGAEFLKGDNNCSLVIPFASLEDFKIEDMIVWEKWHSIDMEAFPKLQHLTISKCPKLTGDFPCQLLSLETLTVSQCPLLASSIPRCPEIRNLKVSESENVVLQQEQELPSSLRSLGISGDHMFESLAHSGSLHVKELHLSDCKQAEFPQQHCHLCLERLLITRSCYTFISLSGFSFSNLNYLSIHRCENLISVLVSNTPLQILQHIIIFDCKNLKRLSDDTEYHLPNLKSLSIEQCPEFEAFPKGFLPSSLRELEIRNCEKLLAHHTEWYLPTLTSLLISGGDDTVKCFPGGCSLPSTLTTLRLNYLLSLDTLNCNGLQHLTSLKELSISLCPKLKNLTGKVLPCSLRKLIIDYCFSLEEQCRNKDGEIWSRISHIPAIRLSHEWFSFDSSIYNHRSK